MEAIEADRRRDELVCREAGKAGLRGRINAMCIYCIYDPIGGFGNWRQQVAACTATACPIHPVRPISTPEKRK